jgi:hypothetical protein
VHLATDPTPAPEPRDISTVREWIVTWTDANGKPHATLVHADSEVAAAEAVWDANGDNYEIHHATSPYLGETTWGFGGLLLTVERLLHQVLQEAKPAADRSPEPEPEPPAQTAPATRWPPEE